MAAINQFLQTWQQTVAAKFQPLQQAYTRLSRRDQIALLGLMAFLWLFAIGYGSWLLHDYAKKSQTAYNSTMSDVFWLRSQAAHIKPNQNNTNPTLSLAEQVRQLLAQAGIANQQVVENADSVQINFSHSQAAVIGNLLSQLNQQGMIIQQLQINQSVPDLLEVQLVLTKKP